MDSNSHKFTDSIDFVAGHYRRDAFSPRRAWSRISAPRFSLRRSPLVAASIAAVVLAASAALIAVYRDNVSAPVATEQVTVTPVQPVTTARFEFDAKPLSEAVVQIETTYGIELTGLPEGDPELTLTFEGTADDLVALINESLDSHISIKR